MFKKLVAVSMIAFAFSTSFAMAQTMFAVVPTNHGIVDVGQAFSTIAAPYINAAVNALILAGVSYLAVILKQRWNINIDQGHRDALVRALQNQAGSLIADGMVKVSGTKVEVDSPALASAANEVLAVIPDAAQHLGLTPDYVAKRIVDFIPQTAAGAQMIASANMTPAAHA